jgi:hypothetical protein
MIRLAAAVLLLGVVALPLSAWPAPPVTWLAAVALAVGGLGVLAWSPSLVTAAGSLVLIAYTAALMIAEAPSRAAPSIALGATLVLLLTLVHFGGRVRGAMLGPSVVAAQVRRWLFVTGLGIAAAAALVAAAPFIAALLAGAPMPIVISAAALGAVLAVAGIIALLGGARAGGGGGWAG